MQTAFPHLDDLPLVYKLVEDYCDRFFPVVKYKRLIFNDDEKDSAHNEIPERAKRWSVSFDLRVYADPADQQYLMDRFGTAEERPVPLQVSVPHLLKAELAWQDPVTKEIVLVAKAGDRFVYSEEIEHDVLTVRRGKMFGNTDIPVYFQFDTMRLPLESDAFAAV